MKHNLNLSQMAQRVVLLIILLPAGAVCLWVFGMGLIGGGFLANGFVETARTYRWPTVPCEILPGVEPAQRGRPAARKTRVQVQLRYEFGGMTFTTNQWVHPTELTYTPLEGVGQNSKGGRWSLCYVNPVEPTQVLLRRQSLWFGLVLIGPLVFMAVGGLGLGFCLRGLIIGMRMTGTRLHEPAPSIRTDFAALRRCGWVRVLSGGLLLTGLLFLYPLVIKPLLRLLGSSAG